MKKKEYLQQIIRFEFDKLNPFTGQDKMKMLIEIAEDNDLDKDYIEEMKNDSLNIY
jgi:hypothetical protein